MKMTLVNKIKKKYVHLKHGMRKIQSLDPEDSNFKELKKKIRQIDKDFPLGTASWENNRKEIRKNILRGNIANFLNWDVVKSTMIYEPPCVEYKKVAKNSLLMRSIKEISIGNPCPYYVNPSTSGNLVHHGYSLSMLLDQCKVGDFNKIVELGGGYGSMCRLFRNMGYMKTYLIYDFPEFSALQEYYLNSIGTNYTKNTMFTDYVEELDNKDKSTLLVATWSLSEMPLDLRAKILANLKFQYCIIAFQAEFDGIDNIEYFEKFKSKYPEVSFGLISIKHLKGHYYLTGTRKNL